MDYFKVSNIMALALSTPYESSEFPERWKVVLNLYEESASDKEIPHHQHQALELLYKKVFEKALQRLELERKKKEEA